MSGGTRRLKSLLERARTVSVPLIVALALTMSLATVLHAQSPARSVTQSATTGAWPVKPLRVIVPFPPGSAADAATRVITVRLAEQLGQQLIVDNRSGASGNIGAEVAARAAPDGYTTLVGTTSTHAVAVSLDEKLSYDPVRNFAPVTRFGSSPYIVLVHLSLPANSPATFQSPSSFASRITLVQRAISAFTIAANTSGVVGFTSIAWSSSRWRSG